MRILLDENLDWRLGRALVGHEVESVQRLGWAGIQNGVLLKKAEEHVKNFRKFFQGCMLTFDSAANWF
jgi:hypothetical protein